MAKLKIITGYPDGTFRPDAPVTRAEFAAIAARFDEKSARTTASFRDIYGHWAERYISRSAELGWIRGYTDNTFRPDQSITRAEAMALINRVLNRNPESKDDLLRSMNIFNDNLDTANGTTWMCRRRQTVTILSVRPTGMRCGRSCEQIRTGKRWSGKRKSRRVHPWGCRACGIPDYKRGRKEDV